MVIDFDALYVSLVNYFVTQEKAMSPLNHSMVNAPSSSSTADEKESQPTHEPITVSSPDESQRHSSDDTFTLIKFLAVTVGIIQPVS